ncbi:MAG: hypothetical protein U0R77_11395 [Mycolicibacterium insubricum]|uniref:Uncharacterized protein n=1 Tax=Mycolicibacterium insubricum TaxID=444597 RepID=A0A1X0DI17_9MYCO|nr:hypothetical protein [Mycolicibacterium insubricum]MCV7082781.1 hypothetical protein [Mycolicibacterium insubricum]ORA72018.1 hypothetical protein BST26_06695 [Mycolicibacterium insubricum]BBZ67512.1 hypothetical protein MINS_29410 [Mycolicibacterium insubricum]
MIDRLEIETTAVGSGKVGPGRYQLKQVYSSSKPYVGIKYGWTSYVGDQELSGHDCTAVGTVTGPGGFEAVQHSDACSRSMYKIGDSVTFNAVGTYNVTVSVTPKDGQEVTATETIEVIAMDK